MRNSKMFFGKLLGKTVKVEAYDCIVYGRLLHVEASEHNGFGNIILHTQNGLVLVRGSNIQTVSEVREGR